MTEQLAEELEATRTLMSCAATDGDDWRRRHAKMRAGEKAFRTSMIAAVTAERLTVERAEDTMDTYRWLRRMTYHLWRIRSWLERVPVG